MTGKYKAIILLLLILLMLIAITGYYVFKHWHHNRYVKPPIQDVIFTKHHNNIVQQNPGAIYGIDVSHYQGNINWKEIDLVPGQKPVEFVFIRASMGAVARDNNFNQNWKSSKDKFIRGAYHYYRPDENSILQAENFIERVTLEKGDLPPVLDIENHPQKQSLDSLKVGLKRWLQLVENHYGVRPIIYSGDHYYTHFLQNEFPDYTLWIANYNLTIQKPKPHWNLWQYSEKGRVNGIQGHVDLNLFNGSLSELRAMTLR